MVVLVYSKGISSFVALISPLSPLPYISPPPKPKVHNLTEYQQQYMSLIFEDKQCIFLLFSNDY